METKTFVIIKALGYDGFNSHCVAELKMYYTSGYKKDNCYIDFINRFKSHVDKFSTQFQDFFCIDGDLFPVESESYIRENLQYWYNCAIIQDSRIVQTMFGVLSTKQIKSIAKAFNVNIIL